MTHHVTGGGCLNRACQVRSWSFEEAGLDLDTGGRLGRRLGRLHIRVHLRWVSWWTRRLLVVTGARCPLTKPAVTAVEQQATTEPHCSRGVQPGSICVHTGTARANSRGPGAGLASRPQTLPTPAPALVLSVHWPQAPPMPAAALVLYIDLCSRRTAPFYYYQRLQNGVQMEAGECLREAGFVSASSSGQEHSDQATASVEDYCDCSGSSSD
jgi:hypothetical protein